MLSYLLNAFPLQIWGGFWDGMGVGVALRAWWGLLLDEGERRSGYAGKLVLDPMLIFQH